MSSESGHRGLCLSKQPRSGVIPECGGVAQVAAQHVNRLVPAHVHHFEQRSSVRGRVPPKYRNPDNPAETWTGRGLPPRWLAAELKRGARMEDFLIGGAPRKRRKLAKARKAKAVRKQARQRKAAKATRATKPRNAPMRRKTSKSPRAGRNPTTRPPAPPPPPADQRVAEIPAT
jgi:hypothetical protein